MTDANLLLGRLLDDLAAGRRPAAATARRPSGPSAGSRPSWSLGPLACAEGIVRVAEAEMLAALRLVTVERGDRPARLRAAAVRRRGPAARGRAGRAARHLAAALPARLRRPLGARAGRRAAPPRPRPQRCSSAAHALARSALERRARQLLERGPARSSAAARRARACATSCATAASPSSWPWRRSARSAGRAPGSAPSAAGGLRARHERRYGYRDPTGELELVKMRVSVWGPRAAR